MILDPKDLKLMKIQKEKKKKIKILKLILFLILPVHHNQDLMYFYQIKY